VGLFTVTLWKGSRRPSLVLVENRSVRTRILGSLQDVGVGVFSTALEGTASISSVFAHLLPELMLTHQLVLLLNGWWSEINYYHSLSKAKPASNQLIPNLRHWRAAGKEGYCVLDMLLARQLRTSLISSGQGKWLSLKALQTANYTLHILDVISEGLNSILSGNLYASFSNSTKYMVEPKRKGWSQKRRRTDSTTKTNTYLGLLLCKHH